MNSLLSWCCWDLGRESWNWSAWVLWCCRSSRFGSSSDLCFHPSPLHLRALPTPTDHPPS